MNQNQLKNIEEEIKKILIQKYPDIQIHVDQINGTDQISIALFWNRISAERWNDAESFRCKLGDYQRTIDNEIRPLAHKNKFYE